MAQTSTIFVAETELRVNETDGFATQRILRNGFLGEELRITYNVTGDTAVDGQDFAGGIGTVTMPAGASGVSVRIRLLDDAAAESTEAFTFSVISTDSANTTLWAPRTSRVSILDNENPAPPPPVEPPPVSDYKVGFQPVVSDLFLPIKVAFSPVDASRAYIAEKTGAIKVADLATGAATTLLDLGDRVNSHHDRGLFDVALHPDLQNNPYLYVFATIDPRDTAGLNDPYAGPDGAGNRYCQVLRYTLDKATGYTTVVPGSETVLLGKAGRSLDDISGGGRQDFTEEAFKNSLPSDRYNTGAPGQTVINGIKQDFIKADSMTHMGGSLAFGPDGALYVSIGDGTSPNYADPRTPDVQNLDSLSGKILRVDPLTGRGLADNPFADGAASLDANRAKVFQLGLRNPFSMGFDTEGRLFISDTGWFSWEMIKTGGPGANFGWPYFEGGDNGELQPSPGYSGFASAQAFYAAVARGDIDVTAPFRAFSHDSDAPGFQVQAITGGSVVYSGSGVYPAEFRDDFFFSDFTGGEIYTVDAKNRAEVKFLYQGAPDGVPVHYEQGPDGYVYYVDLVKGEVGRLRIESLAPPPVRTGTDGDDRLTSGPGDEAIDGRAGHDWLDLRSEGHRGCVATAQPDGKVALAHAGQTDTLANIEAVIFADGRLVFDANDPAARVLRLYEAALDRLPDQEGLNFWIDAVQQHGQPLSALAQGFLGAPEFQARFGGASTSNGAFVDRLYLNTLGRPGDAEGRAFWVGSLDRGDAGRADVLVAFSESAENKAGTAALVQNGIWDRSEEAAEVARLYDTVFGRRPDLEGLTFWKGALDSGAVSHEQMAEVFTGSAEFGARYGGLGNRDFVGVLYVNTLDRPADQAGLDFWTAQLDAGVARSALVLAFSESPEHVRLTAPAIGGENPGEFGILFA